MSEGGRIRTHHVPSLRGLDPELRRKRLIAARRYAVHAIPRFAILLGQWDGGSIVSLAGKAPAKPRRRKKK